jgi:NADH dehydrogenase (ubiquinone) Fe-S protein 4
MFASSMKRFMRVPARYLSSKSVTPPTTTTTTVPNVAPISGAPEELVSERTVRIYRPAKNAMQSGQNNTRLWKIDFDPTSNGYRWENRLMGWASSADPMQAMEIQFNTKEDAIQFAEKQGWTYFIQEPKERKFRPQVYADNFRYSPGKLRLIRTK